MVIRMTYLCNIMLFLTTLSIGVFLSNNTFLFLCSKHARENHIIVYPRSKYLSNNKNSYNNNSSYPCNTNFFVYKVGLRGTGQLIVCTCKHNCKHSRQLIHIKWHWKHNFFFIYHRTNRTHTHLIQVLFS